jgi:hypothetical protein
MASAIGKDVAESAAKSAAEDAASAGIKDAVKSAVESDAKATAKAAAESAVESDIKAATESAAKNAAKSDAEATVKASWKDQVANTTKNLSKALPKLAMLGVAGFAGYELMGGFTSAEKARCSCRDKTTGQPKGAIYNDQKTCEASNGTWSPPNDMEAATCLLNQAGATISDTGAVVLNTANAGVGLLGNVSTGITWVSNHLGLAIGIIVCLLVLILICRWLFIRYFFGNPYQQQPQFHIVHPQRQEHHERQKNDKHKPKHHQPSKDLPFSTKQTHNGRKSTSLSKVIEE